MDKCLAELHIGDDEGDGRATMICGLEKGHQGMHLEQWQGQKGKELLKRMTLWEGDDAHK